MIGLTRPRWKKIKGIYCSLIGSYGFIQSLSQTKSNNQQNNEGSRMRVIFEKGTPSAHINKNMHLECLSQNTVKLQTSVQEVSFDEEQCLLIKNLILLASGYLSYAILMYLCHILTCPIAR